MSISEKKKCILPVVSNCLSAIFNNKWRRLCLLALLFSVSFPTANANTVEQLNVEEGDAVWYDLTVSSTGVVGVNAWTDGTTGSDYVYIYLYNPAGAQVDKDSGYNKASITYTVTTTGTYKVKVYLDDAAGGGTRKISVSSPLALSASPHYKETAIDIAEGDAIWYDLTVSSTGVVGVNTWTDGTTGSDLVYIYLYNPAGAQVDTGSGYNKASITYIATTTGTYKVKVYLVDAAGGGTRKISVSTPFPLLVGISATTPAPTTLTPTPAPTTPVPTTSVPTTPQQTGEIAVYSDQNDVTIYIDDKYAGITSGKSSQYSGLYYGDVSGLTIGTHTFKVTKTNYQEPPSQTVNVVTGSWQVNEKLFFYLEPISVSTLTPTPTVTKIPMVTTTAKATAPTTQTTSPATSSTAVVSVSERTATVTFPSIAAGQYTSIQIPTEKEQAVSKITLSFKKDVSDVKLNIETTPFKPEEVNIEVDGNVYRYLSISPQNIQSSDTYNVEIGFKVDKSWISSNNIDPDTVVLYRYKDNQWNKLSTTKLNEDSAYIYYSAITPGFSIFAISTTLPTGSGMNWVMIGGIGALILLGIIVISKLRTSYNNKSKTIFPETVVIGAPKETPKKPQVKGTIDVKSAHEYNGAKVFYKVKLENNTSETIGDIKINLFVPDVFLLKEKEKSLSMLEPKESKTVTFEIRPTGECGDCNVSGKIEYYDYSTKGREKLNIETKTISVVCPVLKRKEIDAKQWEQVTDELMKAEENIKELSVPAENLFNITSRVIKDSGMFMLEPEITSTPQLFNGIARFYAEGVTGLRYASYIEVVGGTRKSRLILKAWAEKEEALAGFYHRIMDEIEKRIDIKIFIDDAIVQHIHIGDKIGTQVKESVVQHSNFGVGARKCPNCGKEVEINEKFCGECGERF